MNLSEVIKHKFNVLPVLCFTDNAGAGKSRSVSEFSEECFTTGDKVVFATNTRKNRDEFIKAHNKEKIKDLHFVSVLGNGEIISNITDKETEKEYNSYFLIDEDKQPKDKVKALFEDSLITYQEMIDIKSEIKENEQKIKDSQFIAITLAKLQLNGYIKHFYNRFVFLDEMRIDRMITGNDSHEVWGQRLTGTINEDVNKFTRMICKAAHSYFIDDGSGNWKVMPQKIKGVCFLSAEKSVQDAFKSNLFPQIKEHQIIDHENILIDYHVIKPETLTDNDLTVLYVRSTSNNDIKSNRDKWAKFARGLGYEVICDGVTKLSNDKGRKIGDYNIEEVKGLNTMKDKTLCTILSFPNNQQVVNYMASMGSDDSDPRALQDAIKTIVSDNANQAIGRNTGHRNTGKGKHLLIVPVKLQRLLDLDTVSENMYKVTMRGDTKLIDDPVLGAALAATMNSDEHIIDAACCEILDRFSMNKGLARSIKYLKQELKNEMIKCGASEKQIRVGKLVNKSIEALSQVFTKSKLLCSQNGQQRKITAIYDPNETIKFVIGDGGVMDMYQYISKA